MMQANSAKGRVCVVGAGVAGLVTGKVLRDDGFAVTLLTRDASPGGTWAAERVYPALKINSVHGHYWLSGLPMPDPKDSRKTGGRLTGENVRMYMEAYADTFLSGCIRFNTEVVRIERGPAGSGWVVRVRSAATGAHEAAAEDLHFDRLVLCTGGMSSPFVPPNLEAGRSKFRGPVIHSSAFNANIHKILAASESSSEGSTRGTVLVIGGGKSAQDIAAYFASQGRRVKIVFEKVDAILASPVPLPAAIRKSRFMAVFVGHYPMRSRLEKFLHQTTPGSWLIHGFNQFLRWSSFLTFSVPKQSPLRNSPSIFWSLRTNDEGVGSPDGFYTLTRQNKIELLAPARAASFGDDGHSVILNTGEVIDAEAVILATGYQSSWKGLFEDELADEVGLTKQQPTDFHKWDYPSLANPPPRLSEAEHATTLIYRGLIPAKSIDRRDFAINGGVFTTNPAYLFEASAHWISSYFLEDSFLHVPSCEVALRECQRVAAWNRQRYPDMFLWANESYSTSFAFFDWPQAADDLFEDMGLRTMRSGGNWLTWIFRPVDNNELATLTGERRAKRLEATS
ncbi:hypothetical protein HETIRDRAFT_390740 [Heterobasidion irregulare TC 32-1]|uniref:FAD/NAD(P)-binding domain-containing protein n=1 Tax=Heterobasidion irregulare (strain TC 32-1) TaxID=747525 RepID=W4JNV7_HETIT|nr:uncharacterized protein HETIRDRAFT_390740 [Heterobasidion irregulare TC 32-1]ETW75169.1 hypothetical protein HETIRDRAFT_390740 [Heterobasidion irregulare TC 32-1]